MDHSLQRPALPGTTPAAGPMGLKNVYAMKPSANLTTDTTSHPQFHAPTANNNNQRALLEKTVTKIVSKLPFQLRESVTAVITMAMTSAENVQKDLDICYHEIAALRNELAKKSNEVKILKKNCTLSEEKLRNLEENVEVLKDNIDARQKYSIKNKSAMTRLSSTNRMLIDALDALQGNTNPILTSKSTNNLLGTEDRDRPGLLVPISKNKLNKDTQHLEYEETEKKFSMFQNDKLRESLLRVSREHYRSMKNSELLDAKVVELRASLRAQEQANRKLKSELDEVRILLNADTGAAGAEVVAPADTSNVRTYQFGQLDSRFKGLIERNAFDPIDGVQLLRRLMAHSASAPSNLNLHATILHIASRETLKIFECDMVCLFVEDPTRENVLLRYTVKSPLLEDVNTDETHCVAAEVIRAGKVSRINVVSNSVVFNPLVDCCTGVIVKRIMSLPIYDADTNRVFGCIHIINKSQNDLFSEIDEIFGLLFADQASLLMTSCMRYEGMALHANMLQHLLQASTSVFSVIPDADSMVSNRPLQPTEILVTLETISRDILKCPNTRAFLVSEYAGLPPGELVLLEHASKPKLLGINTIITMPLHSGIAGHVIETGKMYKLENDGFDPYVNPLVDIDPLNLPLITVPIVDLHGTVVGCLQLVVGPRSPKLRESEDAKSQQGLLFVPAAEWLTHQIAAPLQYLIKYIGQTVGRPVSTPSNIQMRGTKPDFFMTGLENMAVNKGEDFASSPVHGNADFESLYEKKPASAHNNKVKFFGDDMAALTEERDGLQREVAESRQEVMELFGKLEELESQLKEAVTSRQEAQDTIAAMEAETAVLKQALAEKAANDAAIAALDVALAEALASQAAASDSAVQTAAELAALQATHDALVYETSDYRSTIASLTTQVENLEIYAAAQNSKNKNADGEGGADETVPAENTGDPGDVEERIRVACDAVRESTTQEWKESYEALEQSYIAYKAYSDTQQAENDALKSTTSALETELEALRSELNAEREAAQARHTESSALQEQVATLTTTVAQRDSVQAILQAQIVRMAGANIMQIDQAITDATTPAAAPAPVPVPLKEHHPVSSAPVSGAPTLERAASGEHSGPPSFRRGAPPLSRAPSGTRTSRPPSGGPTGGRPVSGSASGSPRPVTAGVAADGAVSGEGWVEMVDDYHRTYYFNEATGESSWANPAEGAVLRGEWLQTYDESGQRYWVHQVTGESAWEVSEEGEVIDTAGADLEEDDVSSAHLNNMANASIYDTVNSQYSATAGDYTIEL